MIISIREAFLGKKPLPRYKSGHDFILVYDDEGQITPEMKAYPNLFKPNGDFLTPNDYVVLHSLANGSFYICITPNGDCWSSGTDKLYYSPSLNTSVNCGNDMDEGRENVMLLKIYQIIEETGLPVEDEISIEFKVED